MAAASSFDDGSGAGGSDGRAPRSEGLSGSTAEAALVEERAPASEAGRNTGLRWLFLRDESVEPADLLRVLLNSGMGLAVRPLPSSHATALPEAGRNVIVVVASEDLEELIPLCQRVRALAPASTGAGLLACLLSAQVSLPALLAEAARRLRAAGADDLVLGVPTVTELLLRAGVVHEHATSAAAAQKKAAEAPQRFELALRHALRELCGDAAASMRPQRPRDENAPVPTDAETPDQTAAPFVRALGELRDAMGCEQLALSLCSDDADALTLIAAGSESGASDVNTLSTTLSRFPALRGLLTATEGRILPLTDDRERVLLRRVLEIGDEGATYLLPLPRAPQSESAVWALVICESSRPEPSGKALLLDGPQRSAAMAAADLFAIAVRGARLDEALRERTRRVRIQNLIDLRRNQVLDNYRDFFESSADGVAVLDEEGRVLWLNRAAEQQTGYASAGLGGKPFKDLVPEPQHELLRQVMALVLDGQPVSMFDLTVTTTSGEALVLSVSTSSVLSAQRRAVLTFRDVTEKRALETELRKTKDFLERLIDSAVDGIIASDLRGSIVLFNQGAARITGYQPEEVIGKLPVWKLYPGQQARRIMSQLRGGELGGKGRLRQSRQTLVGNHGQLIPVALTAAMIYEGETEVATVGILSDLRERLQIEERLHETQERLAASEKQALVVELAGTAAHELNQPLTSIMGYAELVRRRAVDVAPDVVEYAGILVSEAERMAEIVRKIGRITRYETKSYVGEARIFDLEKASLPDGASPPESTSAEPPPSPDLNSKP